MTRDGSNWDHWKAQFLAWAVAGTGGTWDGPLNADGSLRSDGSIVQWAHTTGKSGSGMKYDMTTPIHLKAPAGKEIVLRNDDERKELKTGLNEIKDVHGYLLGLSDVGGLYYMSKGGSIWDHWKNHFLAWAV